VFSSLSFIVVVAVLLISKDHAALLFGREQNPLAISIGNIGYEYEVSARSKGAQNVGEGPATRCFLLA
jgi:hypothetical protein